MLRALWSSFDPDTRTATILRNEFQAGLFKRVTYPINSTLSKRFTSLKSHDRLR